MPGCKDYFALLFHKSFPCCPAGSSCLSQGNGLLELSPGWVQQCSSVLISGLDSGT